MPAKALLCKEEAIFEYDPEVLLCPVGKDSFKVDSFKVEKCSMVRWVQIWHSFGNHRRCVLWAKEEGDLPVCHQHSVQQPASLMVWGCVSASGIDSVHVLERTMNTERYLKVLEQLMLPSRRHIFQGRPDKQDNVELQNAVITTAWLHQRKVQVLNWPDCSPDLSSIENIWHVHSSAAGNLYQARMGPNSNTKTPKTHNLNAQMSSNCYEKRRPVASITFEIS